MGSGKICFQRRSLWFFGYFLHEQKVARSQSRQGLITKYSLTFPHGQAYNTFCTFDAEIIERKEFDVPEMKHFDMSLTEGPIGKQLLSFTIPLILGNLFQQLYNAADTVIVGQFVGDTALAAVGSSSSLIELLISLFMGIGIGAGVIISRYYGAGDMEAMSRTIHTTVTAGLVSGVVLSVLGVAVTPLLLRWMGTPDNVLPQSILYFRIYFCGVLFTVLYNFGSSIFRALGDAFAVSDVTALSAANAASCFGWLIGFKGATLFSAGEGGTYIALNAQANYAMLLCALIGFVYSTAYTVRYAFCGGQKRREAGEAASSFVAAYCVLTAGALTSLLQYAFCGGANAAQSMLFYAFFFGYIPLLFALLRSRDASAPRVLFGIRTDRTGILLACACALFIVVFALTLPMQFCIPLAEGAAAAMFGWTTLANNGVYRI